MRLTNKIICFLLIAFCLINCKPDAKSPKSTQPDKNQVVAVVRPDFSSTKAYEYIQKQVDFGPRVPGSDAHKACADWLSAELDNLGAKVVIQSGNVIRHDGKQLPMYNIIGSYNPIAKKRLLLSAHWDTRYLADQDNTKENQPIDGANDGGSGVGVLLEVARQLQLKAPNIGVDIVLFDVEDQGQPDNVGAYKPDTYCLGSQYWAKNPHKPGYTAQAGILLDMVGAKDAIFTLEGTSMQYAPELMRSVWDQAIQLKHSKHFNYSRTAPITDDHLYINRYAKIPTIDIIQHDYSTRSGFGTYWHTHDDTMEVIDTSTLQAVGETLMAVIYNF